MSDKKEQVRGMFTTIAANDDGKLPTKIKALPYGDWNTYWYGQVVVTQEVAEQMVAYFTRGIRKGVPIDIDHDGGRAAGWVTGMTAEEDGLWIEIDWTPYGEQALKSKEYRLFSPEWSFDWIDPQTSTHHGPVFIAGTLTNRPLLKELPLLANENGKRYDNKLDLNTSNQVVIVLGKEQTMNIQEILAKKATDRTDEENKHLQDNVADLTDEQKSQLETETVTDGDDDTSTDTTDDTSTEVEDGASDGASDDAGGDEDTSTTDDSDGSQDSNTGGSDDVSASEDGQTVSIKASELRALREKAADSDKQLKMNEVTTEVNTLIKGNDGKTRILPAQKDKVVEFLMSADQKTATAFREIMSGLPGVMIAGEQGDDTQDETSAVKRAEKIIASYKKAGLNEEKAQDKLEREHSALYQEYKKELN